MKAAAAAFAATLVACSPLPRPAEAPAPAPAVRPAAAPASATAPGAPSLRCDNGTTLHWRVEGDEMLLSGLPGGEQKLLRDAGGVAPGQTVWSNERVRVEFGLGERRDEAAVQPLRGAPGTLRCRP